jgi:hypothetical protein
MSTKRRKIAPLRRAVWVERTLAERRPPSSGPEWEEYCAWAEGRLAVSGLPDPASAEGRKLLRTMRVSLR